VVTVTRLPSVPAARRAGARAVPAGERGEAPAQPIVPVFRGPGWGPSVGHGARGRVLLGPGARRPAALTSGRLRTPLRAPHRLAGRHRAPCM